LKHADARLRMGSKATHATRMASPSEQNIQNKHVLCNLRPAQIASQSLMRRNTVEYCTISRIIVLRRPTNQRTVL